MDDSPAMGPMITAAKPRSGKKTTSHRRQELVPIANEIVESLSQQTGETYEWNKKSLSKMLHLIKTGALTSVFSLCNEEEEDHNGNPTCNSPKKLPSQTNTRDKIVDTSNSTLDKIVMPVPVKQRGKPSGMAITHVSITRKNKKKTREGTAYIAKENNQIIKGTFTS